MKVKQWFYPPKRWSRDSCPLYPCVWWQPPVGGELSRENGILPPRHAKCRVSQGRIGIHKAGRWLDWWVKQGTNATLEGLWNLVYSSSVGWISSAPAPLWAALSSHPIPTANSGAGQVVERSQATLPTQERAPCRFGGEGSEHHHPSIQHRQRRHRSHMCSGPQRWPLDRRDGA